MKVLRTGFAQQVSPFVILPAHAVSPSGLISACGSPRWSQCKDEVSSPGCIPPPSARPSVRRQPALRKPCLTLRTHRSRASSRSSLPSITASSAGSVTPVPPATPPPGYGAAPSPVRHSRFDSQERREAPRLVHRLDTRVPVCIVVSLSPSHPYHVTSGYATATSTPSGHAPAAIPVSHSPSQRVVEVAALDQWLAMLIRV